jgi:E3 ubiquitin-protein ligase KEG
VSSPKYGWEDVTRASIGVVYSLEEEGDMGVGFCFRSRPFSCSLTDVEKVTPFEVGQEIHVKSCMSEPRLGWSGETSATTGKIARIDVDGTLNVSLSTRTTVNLNKRKLNPKTFLFRMITWWLLLLPNHEI